MLYKETVDASLLELIQKLCQESELEAFNLVGGTALSLQIGHRKSIDIDLFTNESFDVEEMFDFLKKKYNFNANVKFRNSILGTINQIKVDLITHQYKWLRPVQVIEGIRMVSLEDIAAMKLNAIMGNGSRLKDYVDMAYLSAYFTLQNMLDFFEEKYPNNNSMMAYKSLCWFEDINFDVEIRYMNEGITWDVIKNRIHSMLKDPNKIFKPL